MSIFTASKLNIKDNGMNNIESQKGEIVMYQPDETIRLEVRVEDETVWLTLQQIYLEIINKRKSKKLPTSDIKLLYIYEIQ